MTQTFLDGFISPTGKRVAAPTPRPTPPQEFYAPEFYLELLSHLSPRARSSWRFAAHPVYRRHRSTGLWREEAIGGTTFESVGMRR